MNSRSEKGYIIFFLILGLLYFVLPVIYVGELKYSPNIIQPPLYWLQQHKARIFTHCDFQLNIQAMGLFFDYLGVNGLNLRTITYLLWAIPIAILLAPVLYLFNFRKTSKVIGLFGIILNLVFSSTLLLFVYDINHGIQQEFVRYLHITALFHIYILALLFGLFALLKAREMNNNEYDTYRDHYFE